MLSSAKQKMSRPYSVSNSSYVCVFPDEILTVNSRGLFLGDNPLGYAFPLLTLQLSIISLTTSAIWYLLRPLGQTSVVTQILAGIILGPSLIGRNQDYLQTIFPKGSRSSLETISSFGVMFFLFEMGIKTDPALIRQCGKKSVIIGLFAFIIPLAFSTSMALILKHFVAMDETLAACLPMVAASQALTGFIVISCHLAELKIINTDLGRLAVASSMIADILGISTVAVSLALQQSQQDPVDAILGVLATIGMALVIIFGIRPLILWMIKNTPIGDSMKEIHVFLLFIAVLGVGFFSETIGQHFVLGPLVLGLALPDGKPIGADMIEKLDSFISWILFPTYLTVSGLKTNIYTIDWKSSWIVLIVVGFAFIVKTTAAMLPCLYNNMPFREALVLGLALNTKGVVELLLYNIWSEAHLLHKQEFTLTVISVLILTAIISPIMRAVYDPSKRFVSSKKNTIQHAKRNWEIKILVCIHKQEHVPSVINLLEISNPTLESPISVVVLQLVELIGRSAPILVPHQPEHNYMCGSSRTQNIVNAFGQYQMQNEGISGILPYTAIAHFATMHDDICNLAIDKRVNFVITPFHKEWAIDGKVGSENRSIRTMNIHLLEKAPCSIGIFIDRNIISGSLSVLTSRAFFRIAVIYMGGSDDGEALSYASRMAEHSQVTLSVIRFLQFGCDNARERKIDNDIIDEFKQNTQYINNIEFREELVRDGEGISAVIRDMGNNFDLVLVGRHHKNESKILSGLNEWNECPELGVMGDVFASSDFKGSCSVLVVQQAKIRPGIRTRGDDWDEDEEHGPLNDGTWRISVSRR